MKMKIKSGVNLDHLLLGGKVATSKVLEFSDFAKKYPDELKKIRTEYLMGDSISKIFWTTYTYDMATIFEILDSNEDFSILTRHKFVRIEKNYNNPFPIYSCCPLNEISTSTIIGFKNHCTKIGFKNKYGKNITSSMMADENWQTELIYQINKHRSMIQLPPINQ